MKSTGIVYLGNTLQSNHGFNINQGLRSSNYGAALVLQPSGDLVLSHGTTTLWRSGTANSGANFVWQNWDGELRIERHAKGQITQVWSSKRSSDGFTNSYLYLGDDGNLVVRGDYAGDSQKMWETGTQNFAVNSIPGGGRHWSYQSGFDLGRSIVGAAQFAGHAIDGAAGLVGAAEQAGTDLLAQIPIVGAPLKTIYDGLWDWYTAPLELVLDIGVRGKSVDQAALVRFQQALKGLTAVGPYAEMIVSLVPGIGTGIAAALGAALALANGQPLNNALIAAVKAAIPGGPLVQACFQVSCDVAKAAIDHKGLDLNTAIGIAEDVGLVGLQLPDSIKAQIRQATAMGSQLFNGGVAAGDAAATSLGIDNLLNNLTAGQKKAIQTGLAVGGGAVKQAHIADQVFAQLGKLTEGGVQIAKTVPAVAAIRSTVPSGGTSGFDAGMGVMQMRSPPIAIHTVRLSLPNAVSKQGFDTATALYTGLVVTPPQVDLSAAARGGYAVTIGLVGREDPNSKAAIVDALTQNPSATVGAQAAVADIQAGKAPWYIKLLRTIGLGWLLPEAA